jgi:tetratricopeptide (TPR) repeat protein
MSAKPTAQGTLGKTPFAHLLLYAHDRRLTGTLAIWPEQGAAGGRGQDRLFFQSGTVTAMRSLDRHASLSDAIVELFARTDGPYGFYADQNLLGASEDLLSGKLDIYTALSRGLRAHPRPDLIDAMLLRIGERALRVREGLPLARLDLPPAERSLVERLQKKKASLDELLHDPMLPAADVRRLLYFLTLIRGVETAEGPSALPGVTMDSVPASFKSEPARRDLQQRTYESYPAHSLAPPPAPSIMPPSTAGHLLPAPPPPIGLAPHDGLRWGELAGLYDRLDNLTHYQLLGLAQTATTQDINTAYFGLIKKFHPDRLPLALAPLARCAQALFERLTEANNTLSNAAERAEYDQAVAAGGGTHASSRMMRDVLESTLDFQKAEVLMKRRDFAQAMQHLRTALKKNPDEPDYHALHAWLLHLMNPTDPAPTDEMLNSLDRALKGNPNSDRTHYYRGMVLKRLKRDREALHHFRSAMEINPRNVEATREVRLANMRKESKPPPAASGGLLSKLFKGPKE